ncbi:alpha/beta fold hydrolase [Pseudomarimonas arenosa]|uniref:Alpha/beta fold hydrolase n=1 Tax=Pseudomarimonas arenosa TaxID=2774145 RepID=A0AAW3ZQE0_9GAMM|nr:alpha/beta fold hydrolase [Pseudomarimonas arenosa]MBD8526506.1 alpha/beta fold hydrolase [Pseudomarimonas arenosa]
MPRQRSTRTTDVERRQRLTEEPTERLQLPSGARTALYALRGANTEHTSTSIILPALGVSAGSYLRFARALSDLGRHVLIADLRGVGTSTVRAKRGVDWGYLDLVDEELRTLWQAAETHFPGIDKHWIGHSLGGHLAFIHQARHADQPVQRIELVASGSPWYPNYPGIYRHGTRVLGAFARISSVLLGAFPGDWIGFGGKQASRLMREWAGFVRTGLPGPLADVHWDLAAELQKVKHPVHAICMAGDTYCPRTATEHLISLSSGDARIEQLNSIDGGRLPGHFEWMRHPHAVARMLCEANQASDAATAR